MRERATKRGEADERQARAERRITRGVVDEGTGVPLTRRCGRFETCEGAAWAGARSYVPYSHVSLYLA